MSVEKGDYVAFFHKDTAWITGTVQSITQKGKSTIYACLSDESPPKEYLVSEPPPYKGPRELFHENTDDLLTLALLHEATLLMCLRDRFMQDFVYTKMGTLIISINPFKRIPRYQPEESIEKYLKEGPTIENHPPHAWTVAHQTYFELVNDRQNQTILISGESGAGKTVGAKIVVEYLTAISGQKATLEQRKATEEVGKRVQAASPILESFGNAKTVRNDNSSRFGKFMKIQFDKDGFLVGAHTTKYLLEKSRIITAAHNERVYHVFYQICAHQDHTKYGLKGPESYVTCNAGKCLQIDGVDDAEDQTACIKAMDAVGMTDSEKTSVWRTVAGILTMQNVEFKERPDAQNNPCAYLDDDNKLLAAAACEQFGIDAAGMEREFTTTTSTTKAERITRSLTKAKASDVRDSVSKVLYDQMFQWLVDKINTTTDQPSTSMNWLGLLDIFGFECFEHNSFEQLCINLANEALQFHYNNYIFVEDMKECQREGIDTTEINFDNNERCLDLLMGKSGIFAMLDEECKLTQGTDSSFLQKLHDEFGAGQGKDAKKAHEFYGQPRGETLRNNPNSFIIRHYAGNVIYTVSGWLEKNKEPLKDEIRLICRSSSDPLIQTLLPPPPDSSRPAAQITVGGFFKSQVQELLSVINSTNPHWIRCVKPHPAKKPLMWSNIQVFFQLSSAGVLNTVKVRKAGYPIRFKHEVFRDRYKVLLGTAGLQGGRSSPTTDSENAKQACRVILESHGVDKSMGQMGHTKVFLRQAGFTLLNQRKESALLKYVTKLQAAGRGWKCRSKCFFAYVKKHKQRLEREAHERAEREKREKQLAEAKKKKEEEERRKREELMRTQKNHAAITIQRYVRGHLSRVASFRFFLEEIRAQMEEKAEAALEKQRKAMVELDRVRREAEKREKRRMKVQAQEKKRLREVSREKEKIEQKRSLRAAKRKTMRMADQERRKRSEEKQREHWQHQMQNVALTADVQRNAELKFLKQLEEKEKREKLAGEDRAMHFRRACEQFEAAEDWETNREYYLARDYELQRERERMLRNKQYLLDQNLYTNPPNILFAPGQRSNSRYSNMPTTLTRRQQLLEAAFERRLEDELRVLAGENQGTDTLDQMVAERMRRKAEKKAQKRREGSASASAFTEAVAPPPHPTHPMSFRPPPAAYR